MTTIKNRISEGFKANKWAYIIAGLLIVCCLYLLISKFLDSRRHEQTIHNMQEQSELIVRMNAQKQLTLMVKTFVWAVRSAQIRDNIDEVNQYFNELVKEPNIKEIVLADNKGTVLAATNKKHEGKAFGDLFPAALLRQNDVFFTQQDSVYQVAAPVMALNNKLGTLLILYDVPKVNLRATDKPK
jgi:C4-dicarboxylate-specific signal transduction histidine kinase